MEENKIPKEEKVNRSLFNRATTVLNEKIVNIESKFEEVSQKIDILSMSNDKNHSDNLMDLALALSKAQADMEVAGKSSNAYNFKYADLAEMVKASRDALTKNELSVLQPIITNKVNKKNYLVTLLLHSSGQWIKSTIEIENAELKGKSSIQSFGSSVTYYRRYAYASLVGVVAVKEEDLDSK